MLVTGLPGTGKSTVAEIVADAVSASVLSHDWAMSGLRRYPEIEAALGTMDPPGHRAVGWSILGSLARLQLRHDRWAVLDGVARAPEIDGCRAAAEAEGGGMVVIVTECSDETIHRHRIETRQRDIPDWYELTWSQVERSRATWEPPEGAAVFLDTAAPVSAVVERLRDRFGWMTTTP